MSTLAIMQPYLFPYIGYFQLMSRADEWVVFDDVQFIKKGWINRNRILHPNVDKGWQYFTVPLKKFSLDSKIRQVSINNDMPWQKELFGKLSIYSKAPGYRFVLDFLQSCVESNTENLSQWVVYTLKRTAELLDIDMKWHVASELNGLPERVDHPGCWAWMITRMLGFDRYINPAGGYEIFKEEEFTGNGISLEFLQPTLAPYHQGGREFVAGLSIIDVLMWNELSEVKDMVRQGQLLNYGEVASDRV